MMDFDEDTPDKTGLKVLTAPRVLATLVAVPVTSFAYNYHMEITTGTLCEASRAGPHQPNPNHALWVHVCLMGVWVLVLLPLSVASHPAGAVPNALFGGSEDRPSLLAAWMPRASLRRLHSRNGYIAVVVAITGLFVATFCADGGGLQSRTSKDAQGNAVYTWLRPDSSIYEDPPWPAPLPMLRSWVAQMYTTVLIMTDPFAVPFWFALYTQMMFWFSSVQLISGVMAARRMRAARLQGDTNEYAKQLRHHKALLLCGVAWLSDPAVHRLIFWCRILLIKFVFFPLAHPKAAAKYWAGGGDFELVRMYDNPDRAFVFFIGKMWVNLFMFTLLGAYTVRHPVALERGSISHEPRRFLRCCPRGCLGDYDRTMVTNLGLLLVPFTFNAAALLLAFFLGLLQIPGIIQIELFAVIALMFVTMRLLFFTARTPSGEVK